MPLLKSHEPPILITYNLAVLEGGEAREEGRSPLDLERLGRGLEAIEAAEAVERPEVRPLGVGLEQLIDRDLHKTYC